MFLLPHFEYNNIKHYVICFLKFNINVYMSYKISLNILLINS